MTGYITTVFRKISVSTKQNLKSINRRHSQPENGGLDLSCGPSPLDPSRPSTSTSSREVQPVSSLSVPNSLTDRSQSWYPPAPSNSDPGSTMYSRRKTPLEAPFSRDRDLQSGCYLQRGTHPASPAKTPMMEDICVVVIAVLVSLFAAVFVLGYLNFIVVEPRARSILSETRSESETIASCKLISSTSDFGDPPRPADSKEISLRNHLHTPSHSASEPEIAFDYSLATLGAKVLTTRDTKPVSPMDLAILGIPVLNNVYFAEDSQSDAPLQPIVIPGRCWRFSGFPGTLVIRLAENVDITSVALSHIMGATVPRHRLISAPREFEVWGLREENDVLPHLLGNYTFNFNGASSQEFLVQRPGLFSFPVVELKILSNHGSEDFTCVYRFKVFGMSDDADMV